MLAINNVHPVTVIEGNIACLMEMLPLEEKIDNRVVFFIPVNKRNTLVRGSRGWGNREKKRITITKDEEYEENGQGRRQNCPQSKHDKNRRKQQNYHLALREGTLIFSLACLNVRVSEWAE